MPRYHFNTYDGYATLDREGTVLSGVRAARREAIRLSGLLIESDVAGLHFRDDWRMDVTDAQGRVLFRLDFTVLEFRHPANLAEAQGAIP